MDDDLASRARDDLADEVKRLRDAIREHRDTSGHELCWHHPKLWGLLPEKSDRLPVVPEWPQFMRGCVRYRQSLDDQLASAPRAALELEPVDPKLVVLRFNAAINARDLDALTALMTSDHRFVDRASGGGQGREATRQAWRGFFESFPDYRNDFDTLTSRGDAVTAFGRSRCSVRYLDGPAIWQAVVRDDLVAEWRAHTDTDDLRRALGLPPG